MQTETKTLILNRNDLNKSSKTKSILLIKQTDIKDSIVPIQKNGIVLFVDKNGQTKILKNRYGDRGESRFISVLNDIKTNIGVSNDLGLQLGEKYIDDIIEIIKNN